MLPDRATSKYREIPYTESHFHSELLIQKLSILIPNVHHKMALPVNKFWKNNNPIEANLENQTLKLNNS